MIVTATHLNRLGAYRRSSTQTEERTVNAIKGARLTLDQPLEYEHPGTGEYRGEVVNLSRNVVVESADPQQARGHTMYHRNTRAVVNIYGGNTHCPRGRLRRERRETTTRDGLTTAQRP